MGKKSKRNRTKKPKEENDLQHYDYDDIDDEQMTNNNNNTPPSLRPPSNNDEETPSNLHFEDPFPDVYEDEVILSDDENNNDYDDDDYDDDDDYAMEDKDAAVPWTPWGPLSPEEKLEIDPTAYKMHHALTPEWPSLSFDFLSDGGGDNRTRFPHSLLAVVGTQADKIEKNKITVMKLSELGRMDQSGEEDSDDDDEDDDEEEEEEQTPDPVLEYYSMRHAHGGINRLRAWGNIVAVWGDRGTVSLYNVSPLVDKLERRPSSSSHSKDAFFTYNGHGTEGYAMDWSHANPGHLATGDCHGNIHLWTPTEPLNDTSSPNNSCYDQNSFDISKTYTSSHSVEDLQWSPTEPTVLSAAECDGAIKIYDTRCPSRAMLTCLTNPRDVSKNVDVNVLSWNKRVSNLLASGSDDGVFAVWDLRQLGSSSSSGENKPKPLARFAPHTKPVTSVEWHPVDESMIAVSDDDATYVYDLSIEAEEEEVEMINKEKSIPPQMLFMHCGSTLTKEVHWHPQVTSLMMTTSLSGFSVFIPINL